MSTETITTISPIMQVKICAAAGALASAESRLADVKPEHKQAEESMSESREALFAAQKDAATKHGARETWPPDVVDSIAGLADDFGRRHEKFTPIDRKKRSIDDAVNKLKKQLYVLNLRILDKDDSLFAGGDKLGPDGWRRVEIEDVAGQSPHTLAIAKVGYRTIDDFLKGRPVGIPQAHAEGEIDDADLEACDKAVYRYLERLGVLQHWPKGVGVPTGEQYTIETMPREKGKKAEPVTGTMTIPGVDWSGTMAVRLFDDLRREKVLPDDGEVRAAIGQLHQDSPCAAHVLAHAFDDLSGFLLDYDESQVIAMDQLTAKVVRIAHRAGDPWPGQYAAACAGEAVGGIDALKSWMPQTFEALAEARHDARPKSDKTARGKKTGKKTSKKAAKKSRK